MSKESEESNIKIHIKKSIKKKNMHEIKKFSNDIPLRKDLIFNHQHISRKRFTVQSEKFLDIKIST
jgi:hypothetical protein